MMDWIGDKVKVEIIVKAEGRRFKKLIDAIKDWISPGLLARKQKAEVDAEAYKKVTLAEADSKVLLIKDDTEAKLAQRAIARETTIGIKHQRNIDSVVGKTPKHLSVKQEIEINDETVDWEWRSKFFDYAKHVSREDMQEILARILAEEVSKPGSISLRTLDLLGNLSKEEANSFVRVSRFAIRSTNMSYFLYYHRRTTMNCAILFFLHAVVAAKM